MDAGTAPVAENKAAPGGNSNRKVVLVILLLLLAAVLFTFLPLKEWRDVVRAQIAALGWLAPFAYIFLYVFCTICMIPASVFTILAGSLFGLGWGFLLTVIASNIGANISFFLSKTVLRGRVEKWAAQNPKVHAVTEAVSTGGTKVVMLLRLSPVFPFTLLNYLLGITRLSWLQYCIGSLIGMLPGTAAFVYIGFLTAALADGGKNGAASESKHLQLALQITGFFATVTVTVILTRLARKKLKESQTGN